MSAYNRSLGKKALPVTDELPPYIAPRPGGGAGGPGNLNRGPLPARGTGNLNRGPGNLGGDPPARVPRPPRKEVEEEEEERQEDAERGLVVDASTNDSAYTNKKRGRFQYSPPTARRSVGVALTGGMAAAERRTDPEARARNDRVKKKQETDMLVPKLSEDRVDKTVHWKDVHGIKIEEIALLDKAVRARRFNPGEDIVGRVSFTIGTCRNEQNFSTRQLAVHLYKGGIKSIWIRGKNNYFYGTEGAYCETMKHLFARPSIDDKTADTMTLIEQLPADDHPVPLEEQDYEAAAVAGHAQ